MTARDNHVERTQVPTEVEGADCVTGVRASVWNDEACRLVHEASMRVLAEVGVDIRHPPALRLLGEKGFRVEGSRAYFTEAQVLGAVRTAPSHWSISSRGPAGGELLLDEMHSYYGTGSDCPYVHDSATRERRRARLHDVEEMARLCEHLPSFDFVMSMALPMDVLPAIDDLAPVPAMLGATRKPVIVAPRHGDVVSIIKEMAAVAGGASSVAVYAMPSPPLMHDEAAASKIVACARDQVPLVYAAAPAAGTTGPASVAGLLVLGNAEVLSGLVLHQLVQPGAPFVYSVSTGTLDMRTTVESYAHPDHFLGNHAACDLGRWYGLPTFAYAGVSDSKTLDEQWAAESALTTLLGGLSRANLLHDVGYLESGLQSSLESIVLGEELIAFTRHFLRQPPIDEEALAVDEIIRIGPGGSYLASDYTRSHYRGFWQPQLMDHSAWERWLSAGATSLQDRVRERAAVLMRSEPRFELTADQHRELDALLLAGLQLREAPC